MWDAAGGFNKTFSDLEELPKNCRYHRLQIHPSQGMQCLSAIESGELTTDTLAIVPKTTKLRMSMLKILKTTLRQRRKNSKTYQNFQKQIKR